MLSLLSGIFIDDVRSKQSREMLHRWYWRKTMPVVQPNDSQLLITSDVQETKEGIIKQLVKLLVDGFPKKFDPYQGLS